VSAELYVLPTRLQELEQHIYDGMQQTMSGFIEVGAALLEVRQAKLYESAYHSFDEYCRKRWRIGRNYADKFIGAYDVVRRLREYNCTAFPTSESVARMLKGLSDDRLLEVWRQALEEFGDEPMAKEVLKIRDGPRALQNQTPREVESELVAPRAIRQPAVAQDATDEEVDAEFSRAMPRLYFGLVGMFAAARRDEIEDKIFEWVKDRQSDR
jgi:hypothetical protein